MKFGKKSKHCKKIKIFQNVTVLFGYNRRRYILNSLVKEYFVRY